MMRKRQLALQAQSDCTTPRAASVIIGSLVARMREWLAPRLFLSAPARLPDMAIANSGTANATTALRSLGEIRVDAGFRPFSPREAEILNFPLDDRSLLARLARELRLDFSEADEDEHDPLLLTFANGMPLRLMIDSTSYVDVRGGTQKFRVVLGDQLSTRVTLETGDFDEVRQFVGQYLHVTRARRNAPGGTA